MYAYNGFTMVYSRVAQMGKKLPAMQETCLIPGSGRSPREGNGNPLQYSCLENSLDRGAWWATFHGLTKSQMTGCTCMHCSYIHVLYIT